MLRDGRWARCKSALPAFPEACLPKGSPPAPKGRFRRFSSRRRGNLHPRAAQACFLTSAQPHGHSGERRPGRIRRIGPITQSRPEGDPVILSNDRSGPGCPGTAAMPGMILSLRRPACPPTTGTGLERVPSSVLLRTPGADFCCSCPASTIPAELSSNSFAGSPPRLQQSRRVAVLHQSGGWGRQTPG